MSFPPPDRVRSIAHVKSDEEYKKLYDQSIKDPEGFWSGIANQFYWKEKFAGEFLNYNFDINKGPINIEWMKGGKTNLCYNCVDIHVDKGLGDKIAFYWAGNDPADKGEISFSELQKQVCKFANVLRSKGIVKGDRIAIYMPMIIELPIALLACARLGVVHSVVFGGFSAESLADRILDSKCRMVITADGVWRGTKLIELKVITEKARLSCEKRGHVVESVICVRHLASYALNAVGSMPTYRHKHSHCIVGGDGDGLKIGRRPHEGVPVPWNPKFDCWWHEETAKASDECPVEWLDAEDPSFILYTSGSTGKPKGVQHSVGGYMLYTATTFKYVFDYHENDVYWCTADVGWITGHSYVVYGPLLNGATGVVFEGTPFHPDAGRFWDVVDEYKVSLFYTAPTAIRALMRFGDSSVTKFKRTSLRVLGTVGEPINPEAWMWYHKVVGNSECAIVDTYWQTETGGHALTSLPGAHATKPGSACFPFFGISVGILDENGKEITEAEKEGYLVFRQPWPSTMRTIYGNHERFENTYFRKFPGYYTTGDGARWDSDGYIWVTGRIDDMLNVSGHLLSTAEIESALVEHDLVAEAAVVSHPHEVKGECTYAFVTLNNGVEFTSELVKELKGKVREKIGAFASPDFVQNAPGLPKTRSGKIMRRVLRKIARGEEDFGDTSTLADPSVIETLKKLRPSNN